MYEAHTTVDSVRIQTNNVYDKIIKMEQKIGIRLFSNMLYLSLP